MDGETSHKATTGFAKGDAPARAPSKGARQAAIYALSLLATRGMSIVMLPYVTHTLSPAEYGTLELLQGFADAITVVFGFGLVEAMFRYAGRFGGVDRNELPAAAFGAMLALSLPCAALLQFCAPLFLGLLGPTVPLDALRFILATASLDGVIALALGWIRFDDRPGLYLGLVAGRSAAHVVGVIVALEAGFGVTGIMASGFIASAGLACVLIFVHLRTVGIRFDAAIAMRLVRYGAPIILAGLAAFVLNQFDRLLLVPVVPVTEIAEYALAMKLSFLLTLLFQPLTLWWQPRRIAILAEPGGLERSASVACVGFAYLCVLAVGLAVGGPALIRLATPPDYHGAIALIPWLLLAKAMMLATELVDVGAYYAEDGRRPMAINLVAAGAALALYILLIPSFGVEGAIAATVVAFAVRLAAFLAVSLRRVPIPLPRVRLALLAVGSAAFAALLPPVPGIVAGILAGAAAGLAVALAAFLLGLLSPKAEPSSPPFILPERTA